MNQGYFFGLISGVLLRLFFHISITIVIFVSL